MIFKRIVLHNFGLYKGRHEIDLAPPSPEKPIILFGGLNGGGKTTFLTAIQLALYGKFSNCMNGNKAYDKVLEGFINRDVNPSDGAAIELEIQHFVDGQEENLGIFRSWRKRGKTVSEIFEVRKNGLNDPVMSDRWYEVVEGLIPSKLSHLFFFDGEKIESLADKSASSDFLRAGLHELLGLGLVSTLISDLKVNDRNKLTKGVKNTAIQNELSKVELMLKDLREKRIFLKNKKAGVKSRLDKVTTVENKIKDEYRLRGGDLLDQRESLLADSDRLSRSLNHIDEQLRDLAGDITPLLMVRGLMADVYQQALKEQETVEQRALIEALRNRDNSILNALEENCHDKAILNSLDELFSNDRKSRQSTAKQRTFLGVTPADLTLYSEDQLTFMADKVENLTNHRESVEARKADLDRLLESMPDPEGMEGMTKKLKQQEEEKIRIEIEESVFEEEIDGIGRAIEKAKDSLKRVKAGIVESDFASERMFNVIKTSNKAKSVLLKFQQKLAASHIQRLEDLILTSFRQLLRKNSLVSSIEICPELYELRLLDSSLNHIPTASLSAGERQLLSVAILWGLGKASGRPIPTIVDTPLGRLDGSHRLKLVDNYFPFAAHQVILLSTDEEISGDLYERLKPAIGHEYMLTFNEDSASTEVSTGYEFTGAA